MSKFSTLNVFIANEELKNEYINFIKIHNQQIESLYPNAGFDLLCPDYIEIQKEKHEFVKRSETNEDNLEARANKLQLKLNTSIVCNMIDTNNNYLSYYLYPRSSISKLNIRLANSVGIIDSGYRGEIMGIFDILKDTITLEKYSRVLQICSGDLKPFYVNLVDTIEELGITERGSGGFGSTGK